MYSQQVLSVTAGLGAGLITSETVQAAATCPGFWDSPVLITIFSVTIPMLVAQWFLNRNERKAKAKEEVLNDLVKGISTDK
jgi:hypothetical protein